MKEIHLSDFRIIPDLTSIKRIKMSDERYFSSEFKDYTSNSKFNDILPERGGSPEEYFNPSKKKCTTSLSLGSAIHELILQPEEFVLAEPLDKPTAKLGEFVERCKHYRKNCKTIQETIELAAKDADYYASSIKSNFRKALEKGFAYYWKSRNIEENAIVLPNSLREKCVACVQSLNDNKQVMNKLHPKDDFGDELPSFNEEAFFIDFAVIYQDKVSIVKFKMKADNWTFDSENKVVTLNDLKTTSKPIPWFMNSEYGSMVHYNYYRQMYIYSYILEEYCRRYMGFDSSWTMECNMLVVHTAETCQSGCFHVNDDYLKMGKEEFENIIKQIAYYSIFGYSEKVNFV